MTRPRPKLEDTMGREAVACVQKNDPGSRVVSRVFHAARRLHRAVHQAVGGVAGLVDALGQHALVGRHHIIETGRKDMLGRQPVIQ